MTDAEPITDDDDEVPVKRKWRPWEVVVGCVAVLALVCGAGFEWQARTGYNATLNYLDQSAASHKLVSAKDLQANLHGFTSRQDVLDNANRRHVTLRWPSLLQEYQLKLLIDADDRVSWPDTGVDRRLAQEQAPPVGEVKTGGAPVNPASGSKASSESLPSMNTAGMAPGFEDVVAVTLNENRTRSELPGRLARELIRQAVLIAAEDELGLTTLDTSLGDQIPSGRESGPVDIQLNAIKVTPTTSARIAGETTKLVLSITLRRGGSTGTASRNLLTVKLPVRDWFDPLVEQLEVYSRGRCVEALRQAGFTEPISGKPGTRTLVMVTPDDRMDMVGQFAMVRHLRMQIRESGESPELLGQLVRAYANLGNLIDFHWSPASKALKARALLYAQRLVAKSGATPYSLAHRAYAQALAGQHGMAINTVTAAQAATGTSAPDWLELIDAYCNYKPALLEGVPDPHQELAAYLRSRMVETLDDPLGSLKVVDRFLKINSACFTAAETMTGTESLGVLRHATEKLPQQIWHAAYDRLEEIPGLPPGAKLAAITAQEQSSEGDLEGELHARLDVIRALEQAADEKARPGPSWRVLAEMLRDVSFVQVWRVIRLENRALGISSDESLQAFRPVIDGHRHEEFLNSFVLDKTRSVAALKNYFATIDFAAQDFTMVPAGEEALRFGQNEYLRIMKIISQNADDIFEDGLRKQMKLYFADDHNLIKVSPKWSLSIAEQALLRPGQHSQEWEEQYGSSPAVMIALYRQNLRFNKRPEAIRCLEKMLAVAPASKWYRELAGLYRAQGNRQKWAQSLELALQLPDPGLDHAKVHFELADEYRKQEEWALARPHAIAAAESYSEWGLLMAVTVFEGLEEWDQANAYMRACAERYANSRPGWYFWCVRSGHGDLDEARSLAKRWWQSNQFEGTEAELWTLVAEHLLDGDLSQAQDVLRRMHTQSQNMTAVLFAAVLADEADQPTVRDDLFRQIASQSAHDPVVSELANMFMGVLTGKEQCGWNHYAFEHVVLAANPEYVPRYYLLAGRFLANHGQQASSAEYLQIAATIPEIRSSTTALAADGLHKQKLTAGHPRQNDLPDSLLPVTRLVHRYGTALREGVPAEADRCLTEALRLRPDFVAGLILRGDLRAARGRLADSVTDFNEALRIDPHSLQAHERLAWVLATCDQEDIRDGARALEHAITAATLRQFETPLSVALLAAVNAELGNFDTAIELETRARKLPGIDKMSDDRLQQYQAGRPCRRNPSLIVN